MRLAFGALVIASFACSSEAPEVPAVEEVEEVVQLRLGTDRSGTTGALLGDRIAAILNAQTGQSWSIETESTGGSPENIRRLTRGDLALALARSSLSGAAQHDSLRTLITLESEVVVLVARQGSGVRRVTDLAGKTVVVGAAGGGFEQFVGPILAAHGVDVSDFTPIGATSPAAIEMLGDGSADAAFIALASVEARDEALDSGHVLVPFEESALASVIADQPRLQRTRLAAGTFAGQTADASALDIGPLHVVTAAEQDAELVYRVTRLLYEGREQLSLRDGSGGTGGGIDAVRSTGIEFHPGAVQFYREIGVWRE